MKTTSHMLHNLCAAIALYALLGPGPTIAAQQEPTLYWAQAITSGTSEDRRQAALQDCLRQAVVRVTGDQRLLQSAGFAAMLKHPGDLIREFTYRDRMSGIPMHDEQGSYDRPHDLTCIYEPQKFDQALAQIGAKPWPLPRPTVLVLLEVHDTKVSGFATAKDERYEPMTGSFERIAEQFALPVKMADRLDIYISAMTPKDLARREGAQYLLNGRMTRVKIGWRVNWTLSTEPKMTAWSVENVGFDDAFRVGVRGAAQALSNNGSP